MRDLRPIIWQEAFIKAVDEPDRETLARLIHDAELAIFLRRQQMGDPAEYREEVRAMDVSTQALNAIKDQKLGGEKKLPSLDDSLQAQKSA
jgi:hypothetical protein